MFLPSNILLHTHRKTTAFKVLIIISVTGKHVLLSLFIIINLYVGVLSIISGVQWFLVNVSPFHLSQKCTLTKAFFLSFFNFVSSQVSNYKNSVTVWRSHRIWWILYSVCVHGQVSKWMVFLFLNLIHTTNMTLWKHLNSFKFPMGWCTNSVHLPIFYCNYGFIFHVIFPFIFHACFKRSDAQPDALGAWQMP